mgnify:CR=1 FL=1
MKSPSHRLGDLQLRILQSLWDRPDSSVAEVHTELKPERDLAYTTVATMLRKMETRGLVTHREQGRSFLYRALVAAEDVSRSVGRHLVDRLSAGSLTEAVSHLLTSREVSRDELDQLEKLIKEAVTAISFGARAKGVGWCSQGGSWTNPALVDIIRNGVQRAAFLNSHEIQQFIREQGMFDNYLADGMKQELPMLYYGPLITRNVMPSKGKAVAYLYQHAEAQVMKTAIDVLAQHGIKPMSCSSNSASMPAKTSPFAKAIALYSRQPVRQISSGTTTM